MRDEILHLCHFLNEEGFCSPVQNVKSAEKDPDMFGLL